MKWINYSHQLEQNHTEVSVHFLVEDKPEQNWNNIEWLQLANSDQ